jgi:hypothetical protein
MGMAGLEALGNTNLVTPWGRPSACVPESAVLTVDVITDRWRTSRDRKEQRPMVGSSALSCVRISLAPLACVGAARKSAIADQGLHQAFERAMYSESAAQRLTLAYDGQGARPNHADSSVNFRFTATGSSRCKGRMMTRFLRPHRSAGHDNLIQTEG